MKFELNSYNRNIPDDELISDLQLVAKKLSKKYVSKREYRLHGQYSPDTFLNRFDGWHESLEIAQLSTVRNKNDFHHITDEELIKDIQSVAKNLNQKTLSSKQYDENGEYTRSTIVSRFGSWKQVLLKACLNPTGHKSKIEIGDIMSEVERLWSKLGRQPTTTDIRNGESIYSLNTFSRNFGGWRKTLEYFVNYINEPENNDVIIKDDVIEKKQEITVTKQTKTKKKRRTSRDINLRLRFKVFQRDNFKCCSCGKSPALNVGTVLHVDHIFPWAKGGETIFENLQTLCSDCNYGKSDEIYSAVKMQNK